MEFQGKNKESFEVIKVNSSSCDLIKYGNVGKLTFLWFDTDDNIIEIDAVRYSFDTNSIICLTEFHKLKIIQLHSVKLLRWNRAFYCILDHDIEVGCKGVLYYGASQVPIIQPHSEEIEILTAVWNMLELEMKYRDNLQQEMLQMMLKRILILTTRIYKGQINYQASTELDVEIVRAYNFLIEKHFKEKHTVSEYADLLHKSPKTLSNLFKKLSNKSPLQFIQDRRMLEARRLLGYTDKSISETGFELGFSDVQSFSRFFKKQEGISPVEFKKKITL